ncbi:MAG: hypothetical protein JWQ53_1808 [Klenkia sp.]|nr:hypothetical protein [Klenkia sp.]
MTALDLAVPTRDVAAAALGLLLDAPAPAGLATTTLTDGRGGELELTVLGASHVVTARRDGRTRTEQVSCDAVADGGDLLPGRADRPGYRFTSTVEQVSAGELADRVADLRARAAGRPDWLVAAFPGHAAALTALTGAATDTGWTWQTWHLYPGVDTSDVVTTHSDWSPA